MDRRYEEYALADQVFYEAMHLARRESRFERDTPDGWNRVELGDWVAHIPVPVELRTQGWKIHASACLDNAEGILTEVFDYCVARRIPFKFLRSADLLLLRNSKAADRTASGKFVTIYPADDAQLERALTELGAALHGQAGPYILSDLRWGDGPLYVRYGGFVPRACIGPSGAPVPAIEDDAGTLVPDERGTTFRPPPWVKLPEFLEPHLASRNAATVEELPYRIEEALHFSNGGGVYRAVDRRTEEQVVLKEARPHAGLSRGGLDAVARLERERSMLERLDGLDVGPAVRDSFTLGDHHFVALEFVEGPNFNSLFVERYPLTGTGTSEREIAEYASWALEVYGKIEQAVEAVHGRGIVIGDLHPANVLVRPDGRVALVDWEVAAEPSADGRPGLGAPGFAAPKALSGFDIDRYALACLRLFLFLPLTRLFPLAPGKAEQHAAEIAELFPVPREFLSEAVAIIGLDPSSSRTAVRSWNEPIEPDADGWAAARDAMIGAIRTSASPERDDRLFPGDPMQFARGGAINLAHGAAGVLFALDAVGADRLVEHEAWLVERATNPPADTPVGFYDGLHGVAYTLDRLGYRAEALEVLAQCIDRAAVARPPLGLDLLGGWAGIALNLAHFANETGDPTLQELAGNAADAVANRLGAADVVAEVSGGDHPYAGLLRGSSGPALLFLRRYERTGETALLDLAATALRQELRRCVTTKSGALHVNEGWRTMPYLVDGSAGIGMVLDQYLAHRQDEQFAEAAGAIRTATASPFYIQAGLFYGRAGMILARSITPGPGTGADDPVLAAHVRRLSWHALSYEGGLAFPGEQLLRLSMDLASGTAGVLLAIGSALGDRPVGLPFLTPDQPK